MPRLRALLLAPLCVLTCAPPHVAAERTNVVLVVIDTLRADVAREAHTPNLDRLAADGVAFERAFSHAPMTLPAHTALFSSRLPGESGVTNNGQRVPTDLELWGTWLTDAGWHARAATSLATLWSVTRGSGLDRGFDAWTRGPHEVSSAAAANATLHEHLAGEEPGGGLFLFAHYAEPHEPYAAHEPPDPASATRVTLDGALLATVDAAGDVRLEHSAQLASGPHELVFEAQRPIRLRSCRLEARNEPRPLPALDARDAPRTRVRVAFELEHAGPLELSAWLHDVPRPDELRERYRREVELADRALGELLADLDARGLYDSSLIVFTSDHGEGLGEHGVIGHVRHLFDELLHVPLIVKPAAGDARRALLAEQASALVRHVDVLPTLADLLQLEPPAGARGVSLLKPAPRVLIAETHPPEAPRQLVCLRDEAFKMIHDPAAGSFALYDLARDPLELEDVFATRAAERPTWPAELRHLARPRAQRAGFAAESSGWLRALGYSGE